MELINYGLIDNIKVLMKKSTLFSFSKVGRWMQKLCCIMALANVSDMQWDALVHMYTCIDA